MLNKKGFISFLMVFMLIGALIIPFGAKQDNDALYASIGCYTGLKREQVNYSRKEDKVYYFNGNLPNFESTDTNGCAPIAGAIAIDYYNRKYTELIPGRQSLRYDGMSYPQTREIDELITTLTTLMGGTKNGVTVDKMKAGITSYVNSKGLKTSYNSVMTSYYLKVLFLSIYLGTSFDYGKYVSEINAGRPVILGLNEYHKANIGTVGNTDELSYMYSVSNSNHAMVGFGYRTIKYYRNETYTVWSPTLFNLLRTVTVTSEVNFRSETFLLVSNGQGDITYLNINHSFNVFDAFSLNISK